MSQISVSEGRLESRPIAVRRQQMVEPTNSEEAKTVLARYAREQLDTLLASEHIAARGHVYEVHAGAARDNDDVQRLHEAALTLMLSEPDEIIRQAGIPYMKRWYVTPRPTKEVACTFLHEITNTQPDVPHDHPWDSASVAIEGELVEQWWPGIGEVEKNEPGQNRKIGPGDIVVRGAAHTHALRCDRARTITLMATGTKYNDWAFCRRGEQRMPWRSLELRWDADDRTKIRETVLPESTGTAPGQGQDRGKRMTTLSSVLTRVEADLESILAQASASDVARYVLEPVLKACGWDTGDPRIARASDRHTLWLYDDEGRAVLEAGSRSSAATLRAPNEESAGHEGEPRFRVITNAKRWRIDHRDGSGIEIEGGEDAARALRALISRRRVIEGKSVQSLEQRALEGRLEPAWGQMGREARNGESETGMANALLALSTALADRAGPPTPAELALSEARRFVEERLWPKTPGRGGRKPARLTIEAPNDDNELVAVEGKLVKEIYANALRELQTRRPNAMEQCHAKHPRQFTPGRETLRESARKSAVQIAGYWIEVNLSAEEAQRRLTEALTALEVDGWTIAVAQREIEE